MTQVSAARAIPPHNLEATTAQEAYKTDEVISENDLHYLDTDTLQQALQNSRKIQSLKTSGAWVQLNSLVRLVIRMKAGPGLLESEAEDCSKWLALLQACCSVFKQRDHTEFDESSDDLIQAEGDGVFLPTTLDARQRSCIQSFVVFAVFTKSSAASLFSAFGDLPDTEFHETAF